jgi:hypothetical protein
MSETQYPQRHLRSLALGSSPNHASASTRLLYFLLESHATRIDCSNPAAILEYSLCQLRVAHTAAQPVHSTAVQAIGSTVAWTARNTVVWPVHRTAVQEAGSIVAQLAAGSIVAQLAAGSIVAQLAAGSIVAQLAAGSIVAQLAAGSIVAQLVANGPVVDADYAHRLVCLAFGGDSFQQLGGCLLVSKD